jgi:cyclase
MEAIAPGVYVEARYASGNVGAIVTGTGVVCVDVPMYPSDARHWLGQIASVTDEPIIALVQTDYDQERVVSTPLLDVPVIAQDAAWDKMKIYNNEKTLNQIREILRSDGRNVDWSVRMPSVTFSERLILHKGAREVHVLHGGGHSPATCMVYLPDESLIFTGDMVFNNAHPSMTQAETKQWLSALTALRKMTVDRLIPGYGPMCGKEATHPLSDYIRDMRAMVRRSFQAGRSKSETSSALIPEFMDAFPYDESERDRVRLRVKGGSDRIYDEYRAEAKANAATAKGASKRSATRRHRKRS